MSEKSPENKREYIRTTVLLRVETLDFLDAQSKKELTNRSTIVNQILSEICSPEIFGQIQVQAEENKTNIAQLISKILALYFELSGSQEVKDLSKKTYRERDNMIRHLIRRGIQSYLE